jgi:hypothetical protein
VALARTIEELSSAGCEPDALLEFLEETDGPVPLGQAFAAVYREVEIELVARGMAMRATRLRRAAAAIRNSGTGAVTSVRFEGFYRINPPEAEVIAALRGHAAVAVTPPADDPVRSGVRIGITAAPVIEREADEIARRILERTREGLEFREIGVIVRNPELYAPLLAATFERFGIPARFYFSSPLDEHGVIRYLSAAVGAMEGGWDHAETLAAMRMEASGFGVSGAMDWLDFEVRKQLPGRGIETLRAIVESGGERRAHLARLLDAFSELDAWRGDALGSPKEWAARTQFLAALARPLRPPDGVSWAESAVSRSQAAALAAFESAMDAAAQSFSETRVRFGEFWRRARAVLRLTPLRAPDHRRNAVHVISASEARQWELPVIFVCGLLERQFPRYAQPDPFLGPRARLALNARGIALRTPAAIDEEEALLFHIAVTRATSELVLTYPEMDARGDRNTPSLFLRRFAVEPKPARPVLARRADPRPPSAAFSAIQSRGLLEILAAKHAVMRPTALESFLQCPFQFFGRHTLDLRPAPPRPEDRLDFRVQGTIVHRVLAEWIHEKPPLEPLFERIFDEVCAKEYVPRGYRRETLRRQLRDDLLRAAEDRKLPAAVSSETEAAFEETIGGVPVKGRIDRIDRLTGGRSLVVDYKYSLQTGKYMKNENSLQGPLYTIAAQRMGHDVAAMVYCGLRAGTRDSIQYTGWTDDPALISIRSVNLPITGGWLNDAAAKVTEAAAGIREGRVAPQPFSTEPCRYCDYRDACRYESAATVTAGA